MTIDPIPSPKPRTVWAVSMTKAVYDRIHAIAIVRQTSMSKVVAMALDAFENPQPTKETR